MYTKYFISKTFFTADHLAWPWGNQN